MIKKKRSLFDEKIKSDFRCVKTSLKSILSDYDKNIKLVNDLVLEINEITIITYQFIKLYILHCYHNNKEILIV